ncbi:hypothetical protein BKA62DRAFT_427653 [Auriculariales sp. MPI-PUGE-AT-0066]|nr:hypothetical protein BKA62DRAFT_427653 [Auriculariales sp. MPI-PUGE-AT-0066]
MPLPVTPLSKNLLSSALSHCLHRILHFPHLTWQRIPRSFCTKASVVANMLPLVIFATTLVTAIDTGQLTGTACVQARRRTRALCHSRICECRSADGSSMGDALSSGWTAPAGNDQAGMGQGDHSWASIMVALSVTCTYTHSLLRKNGRLSTIMMILILYLLK